jgi:predicted dehydrogenase
MTLRMAVIGVGSLGQHHARILSALEDVRLLAVVDKDEARGNEIAGKFGTTALKDYRELSEVDAVVVASPTVFHLEHAAYFLEKGVSVLCEKPMASSLEECDKILEAKKKTGAKLLVGHIEHFNPAVEAAREFVTSPGFMEVHRLGVFTGRSLDVDVVYDLMIHDIEISLSLVKKPVESIDAIGVAVLSDHIDIANARLTFEGGCVANLTASRISRDRIRKLRLFEKNSYFSIDYAEQSVEAYKIEQSEGKRNIKPLEVIVEKKEPLLAELQHFVSVVKGETRPKVGGDSGREAVRIASQIVSGINAKWQKTQ